MGADPIEGTLELSDQYSVLLETPANRLQDDIISLIQHLSGKGITGIYVSINKPYNAMNDLFIRNKINTDRLFFIDCITGSAEGDHGNLLFISNLSDLSSLSITITRLIDKIPGEKFLLIDAVHTLWIYHTPDFIARFIQNLTERSYRSRVKMISLIVESEDRRLIRKLIPFFDGMVKMDVRARCSENRSG